VYNAGGGEGMELATKKTDNAVLALLSLGLSAGKGFAGSHT
jgi:hypothetical protein